MIKLNVHEAKTHLSEHLEQLCAGEEDVIVLCKRNVPIAEIRPLPKERAAKRPVGLGRGKVKIPRSFFAPLPDDVLDAFKGRKR